MAVCYFASILEQGVVEYLNTKFVANLPLGLPTKEF